MSQNPNPVHAALELNQANAALLEQASLISPEQLKSFLSIIDESPYELSEWAASIINFDAWAFENKRELSLDHKIEYLSCCLEGSRGGVNLPLAFLLSEYLKTHGVE